MTSKGEADKNETDAQAWPDLAGRLVGRAHHLPVRVYYEDTDFSGIVYHANYLKFCERGRSDFLRLIGIGHSALMAGEGERADRDGLAFAVRRLSAEFLRPARMDDALIVATGVERLRGASIVMAQTVMRDAVALFSLSVEVAMITMAGRPARLPADMRTKLLDFLPESAAEG